MKAAFCIVFLLAGEWKELEHSREEPKFSHPVGVLRLNEEALNAGMKSSKIY